MGDEECINCGRSFDEMYQEKITLEDGICSVCLPKLMKEWQREQKDLYRQWERERF